MPFCKWDNCLILLLGQNRISIVRTLVFPLQFVDGSFFLITHIVVIWVGNQPVHNPLQAGFLGSFLRHISAAVFRPYTKLSLLQWPVRHWQNNCWKQQFSTLVADRLRQRCSDAKVPVLRNGPLRTAWNPLDCQCRTFPSHLRTSSDFNRPHHSILPRHSKCA